LRGSAVDIGATGSLALPLRPTLTVGYARGSSDFRQTGLQENKTRFGGVKRWQRYGELVVQPELSNLSVVSLGAGMLVLENSSIELMTHRLRKVYASDHRSGSRLSAHPQGGSRHAPSSSVSPSVSESAETLSSTLPCASFSSKTTP